MSFAKGEKVKPIWLKLWLIGKVFIVWKRCFFLFLVCQNDSFYRMLSLFSAHGIGIGIGIGMVYIYISNQKGGSGQN